ncbi:MAG: hypothetical protein OXD50_00620 [Chloroflexi bacterium]|nr:hypothetical protein [Chloroflexota bacterium]
MTNEPQGFDLAYTNGAKQDLAAFGADDVATAVRIIRDLLADPTIVNPRVQDVSQDESVQVLQITIANVTFFYRFLNPLVIELIAATPYPVNMD